jgi:5-methylcytosine-specific restriction enzyme A
MNEIMTLSPGDSLNNEQLCNIFKCGPQGGMRRSHKTNTLVIVSNHLKSIYDDRWMGPVFHYTGMGRRGDQSLEFAQNKTLANSSENGPDIHLFEVFENKLYTYAGRMVLFDKPYFEEQPDEEGHLRKACVFPLKYIDGTPPIIPKTLLDESCKKKLRQARKLSNEEIEMRARFGKRNPGSRNVKCQQYDRDPWVSEHARRQANGICQLCGSIAPFYKPNGEPYLETHHIVLLSEGGSDTIDNTVALCPNCHRKMHILKDIKDIDFLKNKVTNAQE